MADKQFVNGIWIREKVFQDGGSLLSLSVKREAIPAIAKQLEELAKDTGWAKLTISELRNPTEKATHSIYVDTFVPKSRQPEQTQGMARTPAPESPLSDASDDVPF